MRAINHSLTGAFIGLSVVDPFVALPLALASHYLLDAIPHYGEKGNSDSLVSRRFIYLLIIDALLCIGLVALIIVRRPDRWLLAVICAFLAASPDFLSINLFYRALKKAPWAPNKYNKFAGYIQWFEKPIGLVVEGAWLVALIICVSIFLK
jgi:hypothetical protein